MRKPRGALFPGVGHDLIFRRWHETKSGFANGGIGVHGVRQILRGVLRGLDMFARLLAGAWRGARKAAVTLLIVILLASNVASITVESYWQLLSNGLEAMIGLSTVSSLVQSDKANLEKRLRSEQARTARLNRAVETKNTALRKSSADLKKAAVTLRKQEQTLARQAMQIAKAESQSKRIGQIAGRVSTRTAKAALLNTESIVAQAVPAAGVAVFVAVTALDVRFSCETMKDMRELELLANPAAPSSGEETRICGMKVPGKEDLWSRAAEVSDWAGEATESAVEFVRRYPRRPSPDLPRPTRHRGRYPRYADGIYTEQPVKHTLRLFTEAVVRRQYGIRKMDS